MPWTYPALKAAVAALSPVAATDAAAAAAINAQTTTLAAQDFPASAARDVLLTAMEWPHVVLRARGTPSGVTPPSSSDQAIAAAIAATELAAGSVVVRASQAASWTAFSNAMSALEAVGDISAASVAAIGALRTPTIPTWQPPVSAADIAASRGF